MKELEEKYDKWHKDTPEKWKFAVIDTMDKDSATSINQRQSLNWLYDDAIDYLFYRSTIRIKNLAKKLGYKEIPCLHCRNIIKYWNQSDSVGWIWSPDKDHLFKKDI